MSMESPPSSADRSNPTGAPPPPPLTPSPPPLPRPAGLHTARSPRMHATEPAAGVERTGTRPQASLHARPRKQSPHGLLPACPGAQTSPLRTPVSRGHSEGVLVRASGPAPGRVTDRRTQPLPRLAAAFVLPPSPQQRQVLLGGPQHGPLSPVSSSFLRNKTIISLSKSPSAAAAEGGYHGFGTKGRPPPAVVSGARWEHDVVFLAAVNSEVAALRNERRRRRLAVADQARVLRDRQRLAQEEEAGKQAKAVQEWQQHRQEGTMTWHAGAVVQEQQHRRQMAALKQATSGELADRAQLQRRCMRMEVERQAEAVAAALRGRQLQVVQEVKAAREAQLGKQLVTRQLAARELEMRCRRETEVAALAEKLVTGGINRQAEIARVTSSMVEVQRNRRNLVTTQAAAVCASSDERQDAIKKQARYQLEVERRRQLEVATQAAILGHQKHRKHMQIDNLVEASGQARLRKQAQIEQQIASFRDAEQRKQRAVEQMAAALGTAEMQRLRAGLQAEAGGKRTSVSGRA